MAINLEEIENTTPIGSSMTIPVIDSPFTASLCCTRKSARRWQVTLTTTSAMGGKQKVRSKVEMSLADAIGSLAEEVDKRIRRDICSSQALLDARYKITGEPQ